MDVYSVFARIMKFIILSDDMLFPDYSSIIDVLLVLQKLCICCMISAFTCLVFCFIYYKWSIHNSQEDE